MRLLVAAGVPFKFSQHMKRTHHYHDHDRFYHRLDREDEWYDYLTERDERQSYELLYAFCIGLAVGIFMTVVVVIKLN